MFAEHIQRPVCVQAQLAKTTSAPGAVKEAVRNFFLDEDSKLEMQLKLLSDWSMLFGRGWGWGVRKYDKNYKPKPCRPTCQLGWICLKSRWFSDAEKFYPYYGDKITFATRHLKEAHGSGLNIRTPRNIDRIFHATVTLYARTQGNPNVVVGRVQKSDNKVRQISNIADATKATVLTKGKKFMLQATDRSTPPATDRAPAEENNTTTAMSADLLSFVECANDHVVSASVDTVEARVEEELIQWQRHPASAATSVLAYWNEIGGGNDVQNLPVVAKILYAVPISAAQIERGFGLCGRMVTPHRTSLSASKIGMAASIFCNRNYLDIGECKNIAPVEMAIYVPTDIFVGVLGEIDDVMAAQLPDIFSASSIDEEMKE
ncbi:hypothetical protein PybrP1_009861 [[Pythium] brassicae (nom. inval.)]|nr:hypothetical protein PybrP1_009861 [[Pythium] brassicae (nom. inval.)]